MIEQIQKVIHKTMEQYEVQFTGKYGVNTQAFSMILATELFKEMNGINQVQPARKR
jgi:acid stress-induced BolA-like protein IbaG/YrbA